MNKVYSMINWENYPSDKTPINESNLKKVDYATDELDNRVITLDTTKLDKETANTMVKDITFDEITGIFTITKLNGSVLTIDTSIEKIATNFRYDYASQKLILTLIDGTTQEIDLSALLTQYEFVDGDIIMFTIDSDGKVSASIKNGSVTEDKLQPNFLADIRVESAKAENSANSAAVSEANAKQYAEESKEIYENFSTAGSVLGIKGDAEETYRTGQVNLTAENIGALPISSVDSELNSESTNPVQNKEIYRALHDLKPEDIGALPKENISQSTAITVPKQYALDAVEKNASVAGTLANQIASLQTVTSATVTKNVDTNTWTCGTVYKVGRLVMWTGMFVLTSDVSANSVIATLPTGYRPIVTATNTIPIELMAHGREYTVNGEITSTGILRVPNNSLTTGIYYGFTIMFICA